MKFYRDRAGSDLFGRGFLKYPPETGLRPRRNIEEAIALFQS